VPPTVIFTARFLVTPNLLSIGYAINVCEANILASKTDVRIEKFKMKIPDITPRHIGIKNVYNPNTKLLVLFFLKSTKSISRPARNIMYNKPAVPDNIILLSRKRRLNPFGPIIAPATMSPSIGGIFSLLNIIGVDKIIISITRNFNIGLVKGKDVSKIFSKIIINHF
jgi:hypothetical protein